jgi:CDP-diacylglycerol--serine O-phosphatidyltransferase
MNSPASSLHVSNALTYVSLAAGLLTIAAAMKGNAAAVGTLLALAALSDTFDGRFARLFRRDAERTEIGVQLDSLVDAISFGLAPIAAIGILLAAGTGAVSIVWWIAGMVYVACAVTRLAFYNTSHAPNDTTGFVGLPTPIAALTWSTVLAFGTNPTSASFVALLLAIAMIAPIPIRRPAGGGLTVVAMWPLVLVVVHMTGR